MTDNLSRVNVPEALRPHIIPVYPPHNNLIFEEWFREQYVGCNTDRVYLDIFPTSYWVNNDYGNDARSRQEMQEYIDDLDQSKRYFSLCQYDDSFMIDWKEKDVLEFNMSKQNGIMLPLISQPHPFKFKGGKKWVANFVGSRTHPIRNSAEKLKQHPDYYISYEAHNIETYCRIIHESMFTLCYRGYGANSFRVCEALQYGSIPVVISDEFVIPFGIDFEEFGILITLENQNNVDEILQSVPIEDIIKKQERLQPVYESTYTYEGCFKQIIAALETECNNRETPGTDATIAE